MTAYYNEIEPFAAAWLRELIKAGHIAPGEVDKGALRMSNPTSCEPLPNAISLLVSGYGHTRCAWQDFPTKMAAYWFVIAIANAIATTF